MQQTENEIAAIVVDTCFKIHSKLGAGLFESVYEEILFYELSKRELRVEKQKSIPVFWDEIKMDVGFKADLIINDKVIIEIKSVETINPFIKNNC